MKHLLLLLALVTLFSCEEDQNELPNIDNCSTNPLETVDWLKTLIQNESPNGLEITQYTFQDQTAFLIDNCINCADNLTTLMSCQQDTLCQFGGIAGINTCPDFENDAKDGQLIFSTPPTSLPNCDKPTIVSAKLFKELEASPIISAKINANCLTIVFNLLITQDPIDDVTLVDSEQILESNPIQRRLKFHLKENLTKPITVKDSTSFDISNLAKQGETVLLNIENYGQLKFTRIPQCGDPNVNCIPESQVVAYKKLKKMLQELRDLSESVPCTNAEAWNFTAVGSKACGGPQLFLAYSTQIDTENFLKKVDIYTKAEDQFNKKWGIVSTCEVIAAPSAIECTDGKAKLIF